VSTTANIKIYDAFTCAAQGYDTSKCLNKEDLCPANEWLGPLVLGGYTLVTQVMMLNLLIAMFRWQQLLSTSTSTNAGFDV